MALFFHEPSSMLPSHSRVVRAVDPTFVRGGEEHSESNKRPANRLGLVCVRAGAGRQDRNLEALAVSFLRSLCNTHLQANLVWHFGLMLVV